MRKTTLLIPFVALMASCAQQEDFNQGWRFALDADTTAAAPDFNDEVWRVIEIPHDWSVEYEKSNVSGVYRKHFKTPDKSDGQRVYLFFDGVCWQSDVYVNGKKAGSSSDGSNGFEYDITDLLRSSGDNVLAVAVNNSQQPDSLRNYASGICRDVRLQVLNPTHFKRSGISISTTDVSAEAAKIDVALSMDGTADCKVQLEVLMLPDDVVVKAEGDYKAGTVKIFKDVTQVEKVDSDSDFFIDLGGDSLSFFDLVSKIESRFGMALEINVNTTRTPLNFAVKVEELAKEQNKEY